MNKKILKLTGTILLISGLAACGDSDKAATLLVPDGENLVARMVGQSVSVGTAADIDTREGTNIDFAGAGHDPLDFACFEMPLVNPTTGVEIGTGVDCLRFDNTDNFPIQIGVAVYTFFVTPEGTLVNHGNTTLGALIDGFGNGGGDTKPTHATGSIPTPATLSLVAGTGEFSARQGRARVSGAVNPDGDGAANPYFDCLWIIELD